MIMDFYIWQDNLHSQVVVAGVYILQVWVVPCTIMDHKMIVYIWDMDETLILLKSLINGTYAECFNGLKDVQRGVEIGKTWENYILDVCDQSFFYEQVRFAFSV